MKPGSQILLHFLYCPAEPIQVSCFRGHPALSGFREFQGWMFVLCWGIPSEKYHWSTVTLLFALYALKNSKFWCFEPVVPDITQISTLPGYIRCPEYPFCSQTADICVPNNYFFFFPIMKRIFIYVCKVCAAFRQVINRFLSTLM